MLFLVTIKAIGTNKKVIKMGFLIFNREFRELESVMSKLRKKIKQSKKIEPSGNGLDNTIRYNLDSVDLFFDVVEPRKFTVKDKADQEILSIDWHFDGYNEMQQARSRLVSDLLNYAREIYHKRVEADRLKAASEKTKKVAEAAKQQKASMETNLQMLLQANKRLKDL